MARNLSIIKYLDAADLIINCWSYSDYISKNNCDECQKILDLNVKILKMKWQRGWGNFEYVIEEKILNQNKNFIDI